MNRRLCLAVGTALLPSLSLAQGSLYGSARIGGVFLDQSATLPADEVDDFQISSADTRIGYAGEEDLRDNLQAIYQIEAGLNLDTNDSDIEVRESFVGIGGEWGRAVAGRLNSPFENMLGQDGWGFTDQLRSFDPFEDTIGDVNALLGYDLFQLRYDNSLRYQSPGFGDFSFAAQFVTDAEQVPLGELHAPAAGRDTGEVGLVGGCAADPGADQVVFLHQVSDIGGQVGERRQEAAAGGLEFGEVRPGAGVADEFV